MDPLHFPPRTPGRNDGQENLAPETDVLDEYTGKTTVPSITAQVVLQRPDQHATTVFWVLNKEESCCTVTDFLNPKPGGWGNPGGGLELIDAFDRLGNLRSFEGMICECGRREVKAETGFIHFQFEPDCATRQFSFLCEMHRSGHRIITLAAQLENFEQRLTENNEIEEVNEIEGAAWFDLSKSPVDLLGGGTYLPYWSHVRRTVTVLERLARNREKGVPPIHPLWKIAFKMGSGDSRFPSGGYCLEPRAWYEEMRYLIDTKATKVDLNRIFELYREKIEVQVAIEGERKRIITSPVRDAQFAATREDMRLLAEYQTRLAQEEQKWLDFIQT